MCRSVPGRVVSFGFDRAGRIKSMTGLNGGESKTYLSGIDYAQHGAIEELSYGGASARKQRYCYNNRLQMRGVIVGSAVNADCSGAGSTLLRLWLDYGAANNGNVKAQDIAGDGFLVRQNYTYDPMNRLQVASENKLPAAGPNGWQQTFGYDRWGNRWVDSAPDKSYGVNLTGVPNSSSWFTAKNRLNVPASHDSGGNVTVAGGFTLSYDAENRIRSAVHATNTSKNQEYAYDGNGRRVRQVSGVGGTRLTTVFVYDANGELAAEYETATGSFPSLSSLCRTCFLAQDHLGSTRAVWDESGLRARYDYLPFGEMVGADRNDRASMTCAAGVVSCFNGAGALTQKFTGKERDAETGLDYFGARYMASAQGRFTSPDAPFADQKPGNPQSWNLYSYVRNSPLALVDRNGNNACGHNDDERCKVTVNIGSRAKNEQGQYDDQFSAADPAIRRQSEYNGIATVTVEDLTPQMYPSELGPSPTVTEQSFLVKTTPSSDNFATLANGTYSGTAVNHHGTPAIALNSDRVVPIVTDVNPNTGAQGTAVGIRVHTSGRDNFTGVFPGGAVSAGCQVVCTTQFNSFAQFTGLRPAAGPQQRQFTVKAYTNENVSRRTR